VFAVADYHIFATVRVGIFRDDVPSVKKTGENSETAESDIDKGVGGADTAFNPYWERWKEKRQEEQEAVDRTHYGRKEAVTGVSSGVAGRLYLAGLR